MDECIKIFTHESIIHMQIASIEKLLDREINFAITINQRDERSNIQFAASKREVSLLAQHLGKTILVKLNNLWVPSF